MNLESMKQASQEAAQRIAQENALGHQAAATVLPGPLAEAFALNQDVIVEQWRVRPFYDIDFEFLAALDHPLSRMYADALDGAETKAMFLPTGLPCWQAAWVLTRDIDEVERAFVDPDVKVKISNSARREFGRLPTRTLAALFAAIMKQVERSSSTTVKYGEAAEAKEGEVVKVAENPTSPLLRMTG